MFCFCSQFLLCNDCLQGSEYELADFDSNNWTEFTKSVETVRKPANEKCAKCKKPAKTKVRKHFSAPLSFSNVKCWPVKTIKWNTGWSHGCWCWLHKCDMPDIIPAKEFDVITHCSLFSVSFLLSGILFLCFSSQARVEQFCMISSGEIFSISSENSLQPLFYN